MLSDKEKKKIIDLIKQGLKNYSIHKKTGHSVNTIQKIREELEETEKNLTQGEDERYTSAEDMMRGMIARMDTYIQTGKLNEKQKNEWKERIRELTRILRVEVEDKIDDAIKKKDQEWNKSIEREYIKKEVATNLESTIQESNTTIQNLKETIVTKDNEIIKYKNLIQQMQNQIKDLKNENFGLYHYIENRFEKDVKRDLTQLENERQMFNADKTHFTIDKETHVSYVSKLYFAAMEKQHTNEMREKQLDEREEKIKKREEELDTLKKQFQ